MIDLDQALRDAEIESATLARELNSLKDQIMEAVKTLDVSPNLVSIRLARSNVNNELESLEQELLKLMDEYKKQSEGC